MKTRIEMPMCRNPWSQLLSQRPDRSSRVPYACAVALFCLLAAPLPAATLVSGNVSGTWTKTGSPYMVIDNCTVPTGQTLTIQPGTTVIVGEGLKLDVRGRLVADGNASDVITFKGVSATNYWDRIQVIHSTLPDSRLSFCNISDADYGLVLQISAMNATMQTRVLNTAFENCKSSCLYVGATGQYRALPINNPIITNCRFSNSKHGVAVRFEGIYEGSGMGAGTYGGGSCSPQISNSVFSALDGAGLVFDVGTFRDLPEASKPSLVNNVIRGCGFGISTKDPYDVKLLNSIIADCDIAVRRVGSLSGQIGFTCFYGNVTNFVGYPSSYGKVVLLNANGTPSDVAMNIFVDPKYAETENFTLSSTSPCIDAGDPTAAYNDKNFPPSLGTAINDMGAYGGPNAVAVGDADADGLPDTWELKYYGSISAYGPNDDPDGDRLSNAEEYAKSTDPTRNDTDGDGYSDRVEVTKGSDPLDPKSVPPTDLSIYVEQVRLEFLPPQNQVNLIQASADLENWITVEQVVGTGDVMNRVYGVTNGFRFFRLQLP